MGWTWERKRLCKWLLGREASELLATFLSGEEDTA